MKDDNTGVKIFLDLKYINVILGLAFMLVGNVLPKIPQNNFTGIKTIWGLQDDEIWTKTQRLSGKLWTIVGTMMIVAIFLPAHIQGMLNGLFFCIVVIVPFIYGWVLYRKRI